MNDENSNENSGSSIEDFLNINQTAIIFEESETDETVSVRLILPSEEQTEGKGITSSSRTLSLALAVGVAEQREEIDSLIKHFLNKFKTDENSVQTDDD